MVFFYKFMEVKLNIFKDSFYFFKEIFSKWSIIVQLVKNDLRNRFIGTDLGIIWAFLLPFFMIFVMRFVLQNGLKIGSVGGYPFLAWLIPSQAVWTFFAESLSFSSITYIEYNYLIKKVNFKISILPLVKILSTIFVHLLFLIVVVIVLLVSKIHFSFYWFQFLYYLFSLFFLLLGLGWFLSSLTVFIRDITQIIQIVLSFGMWLTPIFWDINGMKGKFRYILLANPMTYITEGYRKSFIYNTPFWDKPLWTLYFWAFTIIFLFLGIFIFKKLKPHFADVL